MNKLNAREIGYEATVTSLQQLMVEQFRVAADPREIRPEEPLFSAGVGLSSLEGMELLAVLEKKYGVRIGTPDRWLDDAPTVHRVALYLIENSPRGEHE